MIWQLLPHDLQVPKTMICRFMLSLNFNMGNRLVKPIDGRTINILLKKFTDKLWPAGQKKSQLLAQLRL